MNAKGWLQLAKAAVTGWMNDDAPSKGAAIAYYSMFSMAPLLFIMISVAGLFFGADAVRGMVFEQLADLMGDNGAQAVEEMLAHVSAPSTGAIATLVGGVALVIGATTVFAQLQSALDAVWEVPDEVKKVKQNAIWAFIKARLLSFGLVLGLAFLVVISLILSAAIGAMGKWWGPAFGEWETVAHVVNFVVSFGMLTVVFAAIYKLMPRARIEWRDVWVGAAVTALLFTIGKFAIGLYLGKSDIGSSFGAFGSIIIVMVWVYYSSQIFLLGAEFTWQFAHASGSRKQAAEEKPVLAQAKAAEGKPEGEKLAEVKPVSALGEEPRPLLQRNPVFGAAVAAAFVGGAVLRRLIVSR